MNAPRDLPVLTLDAGGWVVEAERLPSPNFDTRPPGMLTDLLVVHNISLPPGQFGGGEIAAFFQNRLDHDAHPFFDEIRGVHVSSHFLVRRDGALQQFVSCNARAWHAGASAFEGRTRCNDFSIGVELEGTDDLPFTEAQYVTLAALTRVLREHYPIQAVAGHADIAPGRKTDPGPHFEWRRLREMADLAPEALPFQATD
ncbi:MULTISPECIES: 1,6-anhydro-N-acetylmuramyl-L-alanine amidase AmpD [Pandoraea]|jgi:AmpD protein|uniref:1,6-anhydro-N-acetylmuramyl-L-alanine amidase AmpD n=1 Tax=Pandoraea pnomenusa TaxID=93220 RepID=A0A378YL35_9BURK|nr:MULTISPECIES: 1,6-anhydro-N-acetylmuramyl-L-alanine amidase AmpD [Pandoraea]AHB04326.1 N-acetyl-anhydromuranmyl-L-alanine amidase [Pandoraea pnomenusa 3kgm]AHB75284.1 N-acetyl-anhydromuranmyl-L-alanine amidase [Pandoraea pnomenusa]AHN76343.1 N-acetyl-anhydromuranmyl-L-alanine amidase [Pandoraea pnomenusa]AIU27030.1 N-acetyl-anhydromuranmyl-L-alanine amidase [Pandoraea pnomenusa]ANC44240.1 N-acetyl-anhydromuranmyl-L-alanine amidase [Pandoraea pnomenusa]